MPRIRTIKPEIFTSPQVMNLTRDARLLFIGLITQADDEGFGSADTRKIRATIFPGDEDINGQWIDERLADLVRERLALLHESDEHGRLFQLTTWRKHQSIDKARPSDYRKALDEKEKNARDHSSTPRESSPNVREGSDLKDRILPEGSLRARASESEAARARKSGKDTAQLEADARKLAQSGKPVLEIVHLLSQYHVTAEQVAQWIRNNATATAAA